MSVRGRFGIDWRSVVVGISGEVVLGFGWVSGGFRRNAGLVSLREGRVRLQVARVRFGGGFWAVLEVFWMLVRWKKERRRSGVSGWISGAFWMLSRSGLPLENLFPLFWDQNPPLLLSFPPEKHSETPSLSA